MSDEKLILVDERNRATGSGGKAAIHRAGLLHRAFSIFVVDERGRILLQQRNPKKYHSGGLWANACCGHPRPGERTVVAARRRLNEELGVTSDLTFGFFSRYRTELDNGMQENEFVYVYFGKLASEPRLTQPSGRRRAAFGRGDRPPHQAHRQERSPTGSSTISRTTVRHSAARQGNRQPEPCAAWAEWSDSATLRPRSRRSAP
jgi:isopentenyl-diphosphate delta-isomerase type 1